MKQSNDVFGARPYINIIFDTWKFTALGELLARGAGGAFWVCGKPFESLCPLNSAIANRK